MTGKQLADAELVYRVHGRPEQTYGNRFDLERAELRDDLDGGGFVERRDDGTVGACSFRHLEGQCAGHVGVGVLDREIEDLDPPAFTEH